MSPEVARRLIKLLGALRTAVTCSNINMRPIAV